MGAERWIWRWSQGKAELQARVKDAPLIWLQESEELGWES
jgi:hypothetical protein